MEITKDSGETDSPNNGVLQFGFAKYRQMGKRFFEFEKKLQSGWFLLPVGDAAKTEEENLAMAGQLKLDLVSLQFKHISLLVVYEKNDRKEIAPKNEPASLKKVFVMVPCEKSFTEKFILETVKLLAAKYQQNTFYVKFCSESKIKKYCKKDTHKAAFAECEAAFANIGDALDDGRIREEYQCVFKGYRAPSSWIDAVVMERSGMLWY